MAELGVEVHDSVENVNGNQWNNLVAQSAMGHLFHRHEWVRAVEAGFEADGRHAVVSKNGNPVALFPNHVFDVPTPFPSSKWIQPKRIVSTFPGAGGPVIASNEGESVRLLFDAVAEQAPGLTATHRVVTNEFEHVRYCERLVEWGYEPDISTCRFVIDLEDDLEDIVDSMDGSRRQNLRRARSGDVEVREDPATAETVERMYPEYRKNMDRIDGDALPRSFLLELVDRLPENVFVLVAVVDGEDVGTYLYLLDDDRSAVVHFLSAIGDESALEHYPSELLHYDGIEWGKERNYRFYDFNVTASDFSDGVFGHKEQYGGRLLPILVWKRPLSRLVRIGRDVRRWL